MQERSMFVGTDVHQHSIDLTVAESGHGGAVTHFASIGGDLAALDGAVATLRQRGAALHFVYEAGPRGYTIYRHLREVGLACAVVAPAQVPKKAADRVKTDRRDSRTLAIQHRAGALRPIHDVRAQLTRTAISTPAFGRAWPQRDASRCPFGCGKRNEVVKRRAFGPCATGVSRLHSSLIIPVSKV